MSKVTSTKHSHPGNPSVLVGRASGEQEPSSGPALEKSPGQELCVPGFTGFSEVFNDPADSPRKQKGVLRAHGNGNLTSVGFSTSAAEAGMWQAGLRLPAVRGAETPGH